MRDRKKTKTGDEKVFFPMFVDISGKTCVVIGAGRIAARRIRTLADFCGDIRVVAPEAVSAVHAMAEEGMCCWIPRAYGPGDLEGASMVLAATDDPKLNEEIYDECRKRGVPVNVCSDQKKCDFHFPGIVRHEELVIGINGAGRDHGRVRALRERVQELLDQGELGV
ncbi:MAG TPA: siroheme synthase [Lachnospiraceae bacterium]|nr:siroheme synthase [Lachnospiraceae bacterium]